MKINEKNKALTAREKIELVSGTDFMYTNGVERVGIKRISMSDGPHGLRKQAEEYDNGITVSEPSTAFPTASMTACAFNDENLYKMGRAIAEECLHYGVDILLGPGTNIKRNPLCGRNFEYFSEDPYLAGKASASHINGVQSVGVGASLKHFALNNSENYRFMGDSIADMRAMREIYLKPFEIAVKESKPDTVMCAYNKINGTYCSENKWLLTDVLRDEWGFRGAVMTDWGAMHNRSNALLAGLDIEMPGDTSICKKQIADALYDEEVADALKISSSRVAELAEKYGKNSIRQADFEAHNSLAAEIAIDSAVLMKNDGTLPLNRGERVFVVGELFEKMRYQGAGSSMINATKVTSCRDAFDASGVEYTYCKGYRENTEIPDPVLIEEAKASAATADVVLLFIGQTDNTESEGQDRVNMRLADNQLALAEAIFSLGVRVAVVLFGGSPVELPFINEASAILNMYLPGQNGGEAVRSLLFGEKNPSGRLAETWLKSYASVPFGEDYSSEEREIYKEGIYVGYRYHNAYPETVAFPFGSGLSYTTFEYSDFEVALNGEKITVSVDVTNTGKCFGGEVVMVYTGLENAKIPRPLRELRAYTKVYLEPSETRRVTLSFDVDSLSVYSIKNNVWQTESGDYTVYIGGDSLCEKLSSKIHIERNSEIDTEYFSVESVRSISDAEFEKYLGYKIPEKHKTLPLTVESRFSDFKSTFFGKIIYKAVLSMATSRLKAAKKLPEGPERDNRIKGAIFLAKMLDSNTPSSMAMSAGKTVSYNTVEALVYIGNGRLIKAIFTLLKRTRVKYPKEN